MARHLLSEVSFHGVDLICPHRYKGEVTLFWCTGRRALGRRELREEARAAKHETAKQAHSKQPGPLNLLHLMRSCDPEKKPDFILLI